MALEFIKVVIVLLDIMTCIKGENKLNKLNNKLVNKTKYEALYKVIKLYNKLQEFSLMNVYIHAK